MSLFGNLFNKVKDAATGDTGTFLLQGTEGLDRKRNAAYQLSERERLTNARNQLLDALEAQSAPRHMGPTVDEGLESEAQPRPDLNLALMRAAAQGLDISDLSRQQQYANPRGQIINGGDGSYGVFHPDTGQVTTGQLPNQYSDLIRQLKEAQVRAAEALAGQRQSAAGLNAVKTKAGGFAPKQPRAGRQTLPPLPSGKMPIIVSQ